MSKLTLKTLLENLKLALSACSELYSRNSTFTIIIEILEFLKWASHKRGELKIAMSSFDYDNYRKYMLAGTEVVYIPFGNPNI